jgi:hypothetical protein
MFFPNLIERAEARYKYFNLRGSRPEIPAAKVWAWINCGEGTSLTEFCCLHEWACTDGNENRGRIYCVNCGADGDA